MNIGIKKLTANNNQVGFNKKTFNKYPNLLPLKADTVSFGKMTRAQFKGIDRHVIDMKQFTPPLEKFNNNEDFQKWCKEKIDELSKTDLTGKSKKTTANRKRAFKEWYGHLMYENNSYTNSIALLVLDGILKDIKADNNTEIPTLNKNILKDTIEKISKSNGTVNFNKEYKLGLQNESLHSIETELDNNKTGWVVIPSLDNDPKNFKDNVLRTKALSCKTWCTATFNAEGYLSKGDFHVYLDNGKPKLGIRFYKDEVAEIQGELNNSSIPLKYLEIAKEHIKNKKISDRARIDFENAQKVKEEVEAFKAKLNKQGIDVKTCSAKRIFDALNIKYEVDKDGLLILDEYRQPSLDYTFEDLGIKEDDLFKDIKEIRGKVSFNKMQVTNLGSLERIGGDASFYQSNVRNLGNLESIAGKADFGDSQITNLGKLKNIGGDANFGKSKITDLGELENIGGNVKFSRTKIINLGNLQTIGGFASFEHSEITSLGKLKSIGRSADFYESKVKDLGELENIGDNVCFELSRITSLNKLKTIGGNANFRYSIINNMGNLENIGGNADFNCSKMESLGNLKNIGGSADFSHSKITSLGNLEKIGEDAKFSKSKITDLGSLQTIGGKIYLSGSLLSEEDFAQIKHAGLQDSFGYKIHKFGKHLKEKFKR